MAHLTKAVLVVAAGLALPAMAQDAPRMMPGLWESVIQVNGAALGSVQMCLDGSPDALAANLRARGAARSRTPAACDKPVTTQIPGGRRTELSCTSDGHVSHSVIVMTGDMQTHMHAAMTMTRDGGPGIANEVDMNRTGECPAGMKPGETKTNIDPNSIAAVARAFSKKPPAPEQGQ